MIKKKKAKCSNELFLNKKRLGTFFRDDSYNRLGSLSEHMRLMYPFFFRRLC